MGGGLVANRPIQGSVNQAQMQIPSGQGWRVDLSQRLTRIVLAQKPIALLMALLSCLAQSPARVFAALKLALKAEDVDVDDEKFFVKIRQGWSLYTPIFNVERALWEGRYWHCGQPVVNWSVGNAKVVLRSNALLVTKEVSGKEFLDWIGGYFEMNWSVNPHWTAKFDKFPDHPITRGVKPFEINDECAPSSE